MNVFPKEAPIYGGGKIIVELYNELPTEGSSYFLVFKGSQQRHTICADPTWNNSFLQLCAAVPSHATAEEVELSAYVSSGIGVVRVASTDFQYENDSAQQMAAFLLGSVDNLKDLGNCGERFHLAPRDQTDLDERLTAAFKTFQLPQCWSMMGTDLRGTEAAERLLHFSARLGLTQLTTHFLTLPGSQVALSSQNHERLLPEELAFKNGFHDLGQLLQYYRKQSTVFHPYKAVLEQKEERQPLVITTDIKRSSREIENDIQELMKKKLYLSDLESDDGDSENMKELNTTKNGNLFQDLSSKLKDVHMFNTANRSASLPRQVFRNQAPRYQGRVLEDNLRRIRDIHEGIQRLRELNTKQIVVHSTKNGPARLSNSCPALYMTSGDETSIHLDGASITMRNIQHRRTSLSSNSHSLDSTFIESFNVKIHVNDLTPAPSQEFLNLCSPLSESDCSHSGKLLYDGSNISKKSNIGGTASKRLAKRSNKKTPTRRQSWSSLGAVESPEDEGKQLIQRRWSLSSLDSDTEDAFCKSNSTSSFRSKNSRMYHASRNSNLSQVPREKIRNFSDGNCEESLLSKSSKQSASVPSIGCSAADAKENVEPQKTHSVGSLSSSAKNFLVSFRSHPLQKSLSTPTITVEDGVNDQAKEDTNNRQSVQMNSATADSDEDKVFVKRKKRSSIFFKKKPDKHKSKEGKKMAHQYFAYSMSSTPCDVCLKPLNKKQGLKCENCLVVVHDSACKDQVIDCNKFKLQRAQSKSNYVSLTSASSVNGNTSRLPHYPNRYLHLVRPLSQSMVHLANQNKGSLPNSKFNFTVSHSNIPPLGEAASRSSFVNINKMFSEEKDGDGGYELHSNMMEINSASMESLDEGAAEISDLEDNQILKLTEEEPETWNATVDKKVIKKLKDREIKRQEAIYELIITEKHHCLTLEIMQKVYAQGMMKELNAPRETVDRLFPCLGDLVELHKAFLHRLRERQKEGPVIEVISDILAEQFHDQKAEQMKVAYGQFCSQHIESLNMYKEMLKSDRKFQNFIKKCKNKRLCKTRGVPECLLLVTQRITKYILIIESLMKAAKENKEEQETLETIMRHLKNIISSVDVQVADKEKEIRLLEIFNRMDAKTTIFYRGKKFKKSDLLACNRKLRKEGPMTWRSPRGKTIDVTAVLLSDFIFFLHENNQKLFFASLENKPGIVSLQKLLARKKAGQDSCGIYLISSNPNEPEMIELFCKTPKDQKAWMEAIREAIDLCPDEDEGVPSETEEERKLEAAKAARVKQLTSLLHEKDQSIAHICEDRMRILVDLLEMVGIEAEQYENVKYSHLVENPPGKESKELISSAINSASRLASNLYTSGTNLSRSVSSAGERQSDTYVSPLLPKRAETFGGFDNPTKEQVVPVVKVPAFKRKLLHLKEHTELSILPSKSKMEDINLGESLETALQNFGLQTSLSVIGKVPSICGSPDKQHSKKQLLSPSFIQHASFPPFKEVNSEIVSLTTTPLLMTQGKEQLMQIVELAHHLNTVVCAVTHLSSSYESTKVQLAETDYKLTKLTKEKEVRDKKSMYRPEHQLEELRNLQKQLNHDRSAWQQEKAQAESSLKAQREELEKLQEQLKTEQMDVTHQRELLYRKLDALQKQGIILSPSHNVVNLNSCNTRDSDAKDEQHSGTAISESIHPSANDFSHRRTVSYDLGQDRSEEHIPYVSSGSSSAAPSHRIDSKNRPALNIGGGAGTGKVVPLHLSNSATNMQKRQSVAVQPVKQQLPLKLANTHSANGATIAVSQAGPQQVLPMKLALGSLQPGAQTLNAAEGKNAAPKRSHSAASSPSSTLTTPVHVRGGSSPALVQSTSPTNTTISPKYKAENSILHHLKLASEKTKNKKDDSNKEIFC
ncbi:rho guanine nucleotide exchange factor 28-like isoform X4 [Argiope bruennichi]|uniref:rho guanine nucleotide exchange factor 28-like isoform X4 n=1 Tax=Argiope bruennichi TaxID=94029 RepID=UPI0024959772|nr:rho guanine nucleotide exchange factor 28-like isoform X4 [Argiope bruennichi]